MGITREDLLRRGPDLDMTDEEWAKEKADRQFVLDRYIDNDEWNCKIFKKVGILLTSHPGNRPYLKASVETHAKLGYWICLAYDNYLHPQEKTMDYNSIMPAKDVMDHVDTFVMPHYQTWGGVLYPYFWLLKFGVATMKDFEYIYCTNGDFILEKPEGFEELFNMLGDGDVMTCGHDEPGRYANTAGFIIRTKAFIAVVQHMQDHFIPFDVYEKYTQDIGNAEGRFGRAIHDLGLKQVIVEEPNDDMLRVPGKGTWYDKIGFRHIHSEHNHAYRHKAIPPHYQYLDKRFMSREYDQIKEYWDKGQDEEILKSWWAAD